MDDNDDDTDTALTFDHLGELEMGDRMVVADASYLGPQFAGMRATAREGAPGPARQLQLVVDVAPGRWHALIGLDGAGTAAVLLLCRDDELSRPDVLEQADGLGLVQVDSGRLVVVHAGLRDDPDLLTVLPTLAPEDFPGVVLEAGVAVDRLDPGVYTVLASTEQPRTVVFMVLSPG